MEISKLTIRLPKSLVIASKKYATDHHTTLSALVESYLTNLLGLSNLASAPIVRRISGSLPDDLSNTDYHDHLDEKYGQ
jgi:hypothetical protein